MKINKKAKLAIGTSIIAGLVTGCATTDNDTFGQKELSSGYMNQANSAKEQGMKKAKEGACGENKAANIKKVKEATCGGNKAANMEKIKEGKCGEGTCGSAK